MGNGKKKQSQVSSEQDKWDVIYNGLKLIINKQQSQVESLLEDRNLLQQRFILLQQRWESDVRHSESQISQLQRQSVMHELSTFVQNAKSDLLVALKEREAFISKRKLGFVEDEVNDFIACFDILSHRCPDQEDISSKKLYEILKAKPGGGSSSKEVSMSRCEELEKEVAMQKREYEKLSVKSSSDISALQAEITFVWNQYKEMEAKYTSQLQTKNDEIDVANEKIMKLLTDVEKLHSSNAGKDDKMATMKADIINLNDEANQKDREISRLLKELESVRSGSKPLSTSSTGKKESRNRPNTVEIEGSPDLKATVATLEAKITELEAETNQKNGEILTLTKELQLFRSKNNSETPVLKRCTGKKSGSSSGMDNQQGPRQSKRKQDAVLDETPKLFTSQFKIPKLKSQSPQRRQH